MSYIADPLVVWDDSLSVGIQEIDEQHQVLVGLVNELHEAILLQHGDRLCHDILERLVDYTRVHFAVEEALMRLLGYRDYHQHKCHHEALLDQISQLQAKANGGRKSISFELLQFLKRWLTKHIMEEDQQYVGCFKAAGIKTSYP